MSWGKFITFEGGEGAGKSTQIACLAEQLSSASIPHVTTREPGGSALGERIRTLLLDPDGEGRTALTETLLFSAARADHIAQTIAPALQSGTWVLCDRFSDSTRAYQGAADGVSSDILERLERIVVAETKPDLTLLLDLPAEEGLRRAQERAAEDATAGRDPFELRDEAFHRRLRQGFLDIADAEPDRVLRFDAMLPADTIAEEIWAAVSHRFGCT